MFNLYFGFGAIVLIAFVYVNVAWALMFADTPPPGIAGKTGISEPVRPEPKKAEPRVPVLALRPQQLSNPAAHSGR